MTRALLIMILGICAAVVGYLMMLDYRECVAAGGKPVRGLWWPAVECVEGRR